MKYRLEITYHPREKHLPDGISISHGLPLGTVRTLLGFAADGLEEKPWAHKMTIMITEEDETSSKFHGTNGFAT